MKITTIAAFLALVLVGCSATLSPKGNWTKVGSTPLNPTEFSDMQAKGVGNYKRTVLG